MLKRFTGTVLVAVGGVRVEAPETQRVRYAVMYGRRVSQQGECALQDLHLLGGWRVSCSFASRSAFFGRTAMQAGNKRLFGVLARRHIDGEVLFNEPYRLRVHAGRLKDLTVAIEMQAVSESDCLRLESLLPMVSQPVGMHTTEEVAIAHLVAKVTADPVVVLFARSGRLVAFVCEKGEVANRRVESLPDDEATLDTTLYRLAASVGSGYVSAQSDDPVDVSLRIYLGELCPYSLKGVAVRDYPSRQLEKQIAQCVDGGDALAYPELFGLAHVAKHWNFIIPVQQQRAKAWQIALPASAAMTCVAVGVSLNVMAGLTSQPMSSNDIALKRQGIMAEHAELSARLPEGQALENFKELSQLAVQRGQELRADHLLSWVSQELPVGITITGLQFYRVDVGDAGLRQSNKGRGQSMLAKLKELQPKNDLTKREKDPKSYQVVLELSLAGPYDVMEAQAAEVIQKLSPKFTFEQSLLDFDATKNRALLTSVLNTQAKEFQP